MAVGCFTLPAQTLTIDSAVMFALEKHPSISVARTEAARQKRLKRASTDIPKTDIALMRGQFNSIATDENITISQTIPFPLTISMQKKLAKEMITSAQLQEAVAMNDLAYRVRQAFNLLTYLKARRILLQRQDSLFNSSLKASELQFKTGEIPLITKTLAQTQRMEVGNELEKNRNDIERARTTLELLCRTTFTEISGSLDRLIAEEQPNESSGNPLLLLRQQNIRVAFRERKLEASRAYPDLKIAYFNQTLIGTQNINGQDVYFGSSKRFDGFQFGLSLPLWFSGNLNKVRAAAYAEEVSRQEAEGSRLAIEEQLNAVRKEVTKNRNSITYYRESALPSASLLREQTESAFRNGEIDYHNMLVNLRQALAIDEGYLSTLYQYNENLITLQYLHGNK
jgi:heavy metal efflux system protein